MAIYKRGRKFELGMTEHKSSKWPEWDSNLGPPDCESDALTTWPRYLLKQGTGKKKLSLPYFKCHNAVTHQILFFGLVSAASFWGQDLFNPFAPELPVTARADPSPFYPL